MDGAAPPQPKRRWADAFRAYEDRRVLGMLFLGFAAGLPLLLVFGTLSTWYTEAGVKLATIGFASWVGFAYSFKFVWSPIVDRVKLPYLTRRFGRRRGWMMLAQIGIVLGLLAMSRGDPKSDLALMVALAVFVAFCSATQDIAIDAFRIEAAPEALQGAMAGAYQLGYRIAILASGAGALYIAAFLSWPAAYTAMAALGLVGIATTLVVREPAPRDKPSAPDAAPGAAPAAAPRGNGLARAGAWFADAVAGPFVDFFRRNGWMALVILLFIGSFRLADITMGVMANPFYIKIGFSKEEIASVSKIYGVVMSIAGALIGGVVVARYGFVRPLFATALLTALTNLLFAYLAVHGKDVVMLTLIISAENLAGGLAGTVLIAYLSSLTSSAYTATQYALFSSFMSLPGKFIGGFGGQIAEDWGFAAFFTYTTLMGLPAAILALVLMRWKPKPAAAPAPVAG
jgi:MFS transporter, PAT family, beta-lactamase induction signal transducer AmpG